MKHNRRTKGANLDIIFSAHPAYFVTTATGHVITTAILLNIGTTPWTFLRVSTLPNAIANGFHERRLGWAWSVFVSQTCVQAIQRDHITQVDDFAQIDNMKLSLRFHCGWIYVLPWWKQNDSAQSWQCTVLRCLERTTNAVHRGHSRKSSLA
jgi:hypothetical protein